MEEGEEERSGLAGPGKEVGPEACWEERSERAGERRERVGPDRRKKEGSLVWDKKMVFHFFCKVFGFEIKFGFDF